MHGTMFQCLCQFVIYLYRCKALCSNVCVSWLSNCTDVRHCVIWLSSCTDVRHYVPMFVSICYPTVQMHGTMFQCLCQLVIQLYRCMALCSNVCVNWLCICTCAQCCVPLFVSVGYPTVQMHGTMFQCLCQLVIPL